VAPRLESVRGRVQRIQLDSRYPNAAAEVVALYFAGDDFNKCMNIIAMCGQDVDCNAAQIATIYGVMFRAFRENIQNSGTGEYNILFYHGIAGIGKSKLQKNCKVYWTKSILK